MLLSRGRSNKAIARELDIVEKAVKAQLTSAFRRIGTANCLEAALWRASNRLS